MKEAQEIANYINDRMNYWKEELKNEKNSSMKEWTQGQIYEAGKILKHIQDKYNINPNNEQ